MATEADIPHPVSRPKEVVEGKELTCSELSDMTVGENDMVISTESKSGEHEALAKKEPQEDNETHCTVSVTEEEPESDTAVCEKTGEAQKHRSYAEEETPFVAKITEDRATEMEDDSVSAKGTGFAGIEKDSANNDALEHEMSIHPQTNNENDTSSATELENCSEIGESESSKYENSSDIGIEKAKFEYKMTVNEASEGAIMELEDSTKNFEAISKESAETEKASAEFEAEGDAHGSDATEGQSISTQTEKDIKTVEDGENPISAPESTVEDKREIACPETNWTNTEEEINKNENQTTDPLKEQPSAKQLLREIEICDENVINKEQTMEEQSCTEELHLIDAMGKNHETIHEVMDLHLTSTHGLQETAPESPSGMDKSKVAEDLNQEQEAPLWAKALEEEKVIEKPVDLSSSESLASEDKNITEKKEEETDDSDDKIDFAPSAVTEESILGEANLNDELEKTLDTYSEAKGPEVVKTETADTRQQAAEVDSMKLEENSIMVYDPTTQEYEKAEIVGICEEKSDAIAFEVEKVPEAVSESEVLGAKNDESEMVTSIAVGENDTTKIEEKISDAPEALSEQLNQVVKSDGKGEIAPEQTLQAEKIAICDEEYCETKTTIEKNEDGCKKKEDTEVETNKIEEKHEGPSEVLLEPIDQGLEAASKGSIASGLTLQGEKIEEQLQALSYALPSNDENAETTTTVEKTEDGCKRNEDAEDDTSDIEDASEGLSEQIDQIIEATAYDKSAPTPTSEAEKTEEQSQVTSSVVLSNEEDGGSTTTIEKTAGSTKQHDTEVETPVSSDGETPGMVSRTCEGEYNAIVDKSDADMAKFEEAGTSEAVFEPKETCFEGINDDTKSTAEITDSGKMEEANEEISNQTIEKIEDGSTKRVEAEVDNIMSDETTVALSDFPLTDNANQERVNKVTDLDQTATQGLQVTASDNPAEMNKSEVAADLNQEMEATPPIKALEEEIQVIQVIEEPVNLSSSELLVTDEKLNKGKKAETEDFDNKTDIAQESLTEVSISGEVNLDDEPAKAFGTISDTETPETMKADDPSQQDAEVDCVNCEDASSVVSCLQTHEHEEADNLSIHGEKSDAIHINVEATKIADDEENECTKKDDEEVGMNEIEDASETVSEPINQGVEATSKDENIPSPTLKGETVEEHLVDTNEIEEQRGDGLEVLYELINQGVEAASNDQVDPRPIQAEKTEEKLQVSASAMAFNEEDDKTQAAIAWTKDGCIREDDADVNTNGVEQQIVDARNTLSEPVNQGVEATSKDESIPCPSLQGETIEENLVEANEIEEQKGNALEALYELINQHVEAASNDEIAPGPILQAEKTEEQLQVPSSAMVSTEEEDESQTTVALAEDRSKRRDDSDADTDGVGEQNVDAKALSEATNQEVKADHNDNIALGPTDEAKEREEQLQVLSSVELSDKEYGETVSMVQMTEDGCAKKDETEADSLEHEETPGMVSQPSTTTGESANNAIVKSDTVEVDEESTSKAVSEPEDLGFEEIHDSQTSPTAEITDTHQIVENGTAIEKIEGESTSNVEAEIDDVKLEEATAMLSQFPTTENEVVDKNATVEKSEGYEFEVEETEFSDAVAEFELHGAAKESTKEDETQQNEKVADSSEVGATEKTTLQNEEPRELDESITENGVVDKESATFEKSEGSEFLVDETKFFDAVFESELHGAPMVSMKEDETQLNEEAVDSFEAGAKEKPSLQNEEPRELDIANFDQMARKDSQNQAPEKERRFLEDDSEVKPQGYISEAKYAGFASEHEKTPAYCSMEDILKDENAIGLPSPHPTIKELSIEEGEATKNDTSVEKVTDEKEAMRISHPVAPHGEKEAVDSFEAGATEKPSLQNEEPRELDVADSDQMARKDSHNQVPEQERRFLEDDSEVKPQGYISEAKYAGFASEHEKTPAYCSMEDILKDENTIGLPSPPPTIKELSIEEGEATKNDTSVEKAINQGELQQITEEKEAMRILHPVSPHEETVTKTEQQNGLLDSPEREDKIKAEPYQGEKSATFNKQSDEIPREKLFDKQTTAVTATIVEGGKSIQTENHAMDEDMVELSTNGNDNNLLEPKIPIAATPNGDEESQHLNDEPHVLSNGNDTEVPHEKTITYYEVTEDVKELEEGVEQGEEKKLGEGCQETAERSIVMETDKGSQKKSHNILSGVGSKMKRSIAKVKKVITGKSSHPKTSSSPPSERKNKT